MADTFTAMATGNPGLTHERACRQASPSAHRPSGTMSPDSSAIETNSLGPIRPRSGSRQRTIASTPAIAPVSRATFGW